MRRLRSLCLPLIVSAFLLACSSASAKGADPITEAWSHWPYPTSCGIGIPFNPVTTFRGPAAAEEGTTPAEIALRSILTDPQLGWLGYPPSGWRLVSEDAELAVFVSGQLSTQIDQLQFLSVAQNEGVWKWNGSGSCQLRSVLPEGEVVTWDLAREQPALDEDTRFIRINLGAGGCASGASQNDRARKPVFRQLGRKLLLTMSIEPMPPGIYTCIGVIDPPMRVRLPGRLGNRTLFDGASYPPRSASETRSARLRQ